MRWCPIETDLLSGLEALGAGAPTADDARPPRPEGPLYLVAPEGAEDDVALVRLLVAEGRAFHEAELDVARRQAAALEKRAAALAGGVEHDRAGAAGPRSLPGHEEALARLDLARRRAQEHEARLQRLSGTTAEATARSALRRFARRPRADLADLRAREGKGEVVELFQDGWSMRRTLPERLAARREHLGLPAGADYRSA